MALLAQLSPTDVTTALTNRNVLVIGGTAGIGKALAISLLNNGAKVTIVGRRQPDAELAAAKFVQKDLSVMKNAAALADEVDIASQDTIVFTNGIFASSVRQVNPEGVELDLAVSYLSRFVFSRSIVNKGFGSKRANINIKPRIYVMAYPGQKAQANLDDFNFDKSYSAWPAHMNTVVANEALVTYLNREFKGSVNAYGLNPGLIKTEIRDNYLGKNSWLSWILESLIGWFTPTAQMYADNSLVHLLATSDLEDKPGTLIDQKRKTLAPNPWLDSNNIDRIVSESNKLADKALAAAAK